VTSQWRQFVSLRYSHPCDVVTVRHPPHLATQLCWLRWALYRYTGWFKT